MKIKENHKSLLLQYKRNYQNAARIFDRERVRIFRLATTIMQRGGFYKAINFFTRGLSFLVVVLSKLVYVNRITAGNSPPVARRFFVKNNHFYAI